MSREHAVARLRRIPTIAAIALGIISAAHCGGQTSTSVGPQDASSPDASPDVVSNVDAANLLKCDGGSVTPVGRSAGAQCSVTPSGNGSPPIACTTIADCQDSGVFGFQACRAGTCAIDPCLVDADCPSGQACGCSTDFRGNGPRMNRCVPTGCRSDGDCANGESCSPSYDPMCGSLSGYYCHSAADTCTTDATCCAPGDATLYGCAYAPQLGHFACQERHGCNG